MLVFSGLVSIDKSNTGLEKVDGVWTFEIEPLDHVLFIIGLAFFR